MSLIHSNNTPRQPAPVASFSEVSFKPDDRILVLAPHPDDETIAAERVYDQDRRLTQTPVGVDRTAKSGTLRIPPASLGNPQWLMSSAQTYVGAIPLDWSAWRIASVPQPKR